MSQIWTPEVWHKSPEELVAEAKVALFAERDALENVALATPKNAMAGTKPAPYNEQEQLIAAISPGRNVADEWLSAMKDLRATEPLYGKSAVLTSNADEANPPA